MAKEARSHLKNMMETYQTTIDELISFGSDREAFEKKIEQIILDLSGRKKRAVLCSCISVLQQQ